MSIALRLCIIAAVCFCASAFQLKVGNVTGKLAYHEEVRVSAFIGMRREKNVYYNTYNNSLPIKGVWAIDLDNSKSEARISQGTVGVTPFVNVRMDGERGKRLRYSVNIYV